MALSDGFLHLAELHRDGETRWELQGWDEDQRDSVWVAGARGALWLQEVFTLLLPTAERGIRGSAMLPCDSGSEGGVLCPLHSSTPSEMNCPWATRRSWINGRTGISCIQNRTNHFMEVILRTWCQR